jgi:hypothetical protein
MYMVVVAQVTDLTIDTDHSLLAHHIWVDHNHLHTPMAIMHTITNLIVLGVLEVMVLDMVAEEHEDVKAS